MWAWKLRLFLSWFRDDTWTTFRDFEHHIPVILEGHTATITVTEDHREFQDFRLRRGRLTYTIRDVVVMPPHQHCRCAVAHLEVKPMAEGAPSPYRIPSLNGRGTVWAVGCAICHKPIRLGRDLDTAKDMVSGGPIVHPECKNVPSIRTPLMDGLEII